MEIWRAFMGQEGWLRRAWQFLFTVYAAIVGFTITGLGAEGLETLFREIGLTFETTSAMQVSVIVFATVVALVAAIVLSYHTVPQKFVRTVNLLRYDENNDVLFVGNEPSIAFRYVTFQDVLTAIENEAGREAALSAFWAAGKDAGDRFSQNFPNIVKVLRGKGVNGFIKNFDGLRPQKKLDAWAKYESEAGWGSIRAIYNQPGRQVHIVSQTDLYRETRTGSIFAHFFSAYAESALARLLGVDKIKLATALCHNELTSPSKFGNPHWSRRLLLIRVVK